MSSINKFKIFYQKYKIIIGFLGLQTIIFLVLYTSFFARSDSERSIFYILMFLLCLLSYYTLYRIFIVINEQAKLEAETSLLAEQRKIQSEYLDASRENKEIFFQLREKLLKELEDEGNTYDEEEARKRALAIMEESSNLYHIDYCENKIIDAILYNKMLLAKKHHIKTSVQVLIQDHLPIKNIDLMFVFTNLLDNAIEACCQLPENERFIEIEGMKKANYLVVKVVNSKRKDIQLKKDMPSTKEDSENHGLGLKIVQRCCKQNHGVFELEDHGDSVTICVTLALSEENA